MSDIAALKPRVFHYKHFAGFGNPHLEQQIADWINSLSPDNLGEDVKGFLAHGVDNKFTIHVVCRNGRGCGKVAVAKGQWGGTTRGEDFATALNHRQVSLFGVLKAGESPPETLLYYAYLEVEGPLAT